MLYCFIQSIVKNISNNFVNKMNMNYNYEKY